MVNDGVPVDGTQDGPEDSHEAAMARTADALAEIGTELFIGEGGDITARDPIETVHLGTLSRTGAWDWDEDEPAGPQLAGDEIAASADGAPAAAPSGGRVRVIPPWVADRRVMGPWVAGRAVDGLVWSAFHAVRTPWYALRGLGVIVAGVGRWVARSDDDAQHKADLEAAGSVWERGRLRRARVRGRVVRGVAALVPVGLLGVWVQVGQWDLVTGIAGAVVFGALAGVGSQVGQARPAGRDAAVLRRRVPGLSRPFVTEALAIVGCGQVNLPSGGMAGPVVVSSSPGRGGDVLVIDLPPGMAVSRLLKRHEEFAQALGRPLECVVIEPQPHVSPGRFELFVAGKRLDEKGAPVWVWRDGRARSFFDGVPVGLDARGRDVVVPLFEANGLIAGGTGMGKSYSARLLLMGAALDPNVTILVHNLKGGVDYRAFAPVAHTLRAGSSPADIEALTADLAWVQSEIARRGKVLESMPSVRVPEGKLTPQVAAEPGMGPIVLLVDEVQRAFASKDGKRIAAMLEDVVRTGRAVGVSVHLVTQGTKDGAIPSGIMDQLARRIGHGVTTISDANLILGSDAHGRGHSAVDIETPGIAYVGSAGGHMVKAAMAKVDLPEVEEIVQRAAALRVKAGKLTGMAAGDVPADQHDSSVGAFLADVLSVWPDEDGEPRRNAGSDELAQLLVGCDPDEYADTTGPDVSRRMAQAGVKVSTQRTPAGPVRGVKRSDVVQAASAHGEA